MPQPSIREEVLQARRSSTLGGVRIAQPLGLWWLTGAALLVSLALVLFVCLGSYTRRSTVAGQLVPSQGLLAVLAPATGVLSWFGGAEGEQVVAGGALALVRMPHAMPETGDTQAALEQKLAQRQGSLDAAHAAQHQRLRAQAQGLAQQIRAVRSELEEIIAGVATRQQQVDMANETLRQMEADPDMEPAVLRQQRAAMLEYTAQLHELQRQAGTARRQLAQLQQARREVPAQARSADAEYQRDEAELFQERLQARARGAALVTAPVAGTIATQLVKPGQAVHAGQVLLNILPGDGHLEAELWVPSRLVGFIAPGDVVWLRYRAFPYQKFGHQRAYISAISRSATTAAELGQRAVGAPASEPLYRVTLELAAQVINVRDKAVPLRPGMVMDAELMGERRRLIEWILEPLQSLR